MRARDLGATALLLSLTLLPGAVWGQSGKTNVYVMDFVDQSQRKNDQTAKFTRDFELALVQSSCYTVLESREYSRLLTEIDRESAIRDMAGLSAAALANLKAQKADMVVFGEVFDDIDSGQINITVTFQKFDRTKALIKNALLPRGKANDAESRQQVMSKLVGGLCERTATILRRFSNDFIFDLDGCSIQDRKVTCDLTVTNDGEDRDLYVKNNYSSRNGVRQQTRIYDDASSETLASRVLLARRESNAYGVANTLISGRPAELRVIFDGVSSKATTITRLNLECWESENETVFTVNFRNIPLVK